jgi:hydroxyacid-oxoacid transhydrogenase
MKPAIAFEMAVSSVRFGPGVTGDVGMDLADMGARTALVIADPAVSRLPLDGARGQPPCARVMDALAAAGVQARLYDRVSIEPTDASWADAVAFAARRCRYRAR